MTDQNSFTIARAWIGIAVMLLAGIAFSASRACAQAADGPQSGAAPSDSPSSSPAAHPVPQIGGHPSLAGSWTLNKDQSDDPREKMRDAMGGGGGGTNAGGGMGGGGGRGMGGGRRGGGQGGGMFADFSQLTIEQTPSSAKVTGSSGRVLAILASGDSSQSGGANNSGGSSNSDNADSQRGRFEVSPAPAQWQGNQLVATTEGRRGGSTTRTYELSPDGTQLYVTTKMDNPRFQQPLTFRFVYDAANSKSGASQ